MATLREKRQGLWEVRVFAGRDASGIPVQLSKTVRGTKKDAQRLAAQLTLRPSPTAGHRTVAELLDDYVKHKTPLWAIQTQHGNEGRAKSIKRDAIAAMSAARIGVAEVDAWHLRLRRRGLGEGAVRNALVLAAVFQQAVRWEWITHNPVASATLRRQRVQPRDAMTPDEVNRVLAAAAEFDPAAALALRLAAVAGARRGELAALRWEKVLTQATRKPR